MIHWNLVHRTFWLIGLLTLSLALGIVKGGEWLANSQGMQRVLAASLVADHETLLAMLDAGTLAGERKDLLGWATGMSLAHNGQVPEAVRAWSAIAEPATSARLETMLTRMARAYESQGNWAQAERMLLALLGLRPRDWTRYRNLGDYYLRRELSDKADNIFAQGRLATADAGRWYLGGRSAEIRQDWAGAIEQYRQAIALGASEPELFFRLSVLLERRNKDLDGAIAACESAVRLAPENYICYERLGLLSLQADDLQRAEEWFAAGYDRVVDESYRGLLTRRWGDVDLLQAQPLEAITHYRLALDLSPSDTAALIGLARAYRAIGDLALAIQSSAEAIRLEAARGQAPIAWYLDLAQTYELAGEHEAARNTYLTVLSFDPDNEAAATGLSQIEENK